MTSKTNIIQRTQIRLKVELVDESCVTGRLVKIETLPDSDAMPIHARKCVVTIDSELLGTLDINARFIRHIQVNSDWKIFDYDFEPTNPTVVIDTLLKVMRESR